jgi:hypothetical protein
LLYLPSRRIFSQFLTKEIKSAENIKDRSNRHNVLRVLGIIQTNLDYFQMNNNKGLFIFCGIDEFGEEILHVLEPQLQSNMFYYNCGSKFITDIFERYFDNYTGSIIFVDGEECIIYKFNGSEFEQTVRFDSRIGKKQKKGGQSAARFGRIADNERDKFVITVIEHINKLNKRTNWIFGSQDIIDDIFERKHQITVELCNGGYIQFDKDTILETDKWITYMKNTCQSDTECKRVIDLIEMGSMLLEFDQNCILENLDSYEYILVTPQSQLYETELPVKIIKLSSSSKYYSKLKDFVIIGIKYFNYMKNNDDHDAENDFDDFM